ncbi:helix-turn-helix domain-containing protein, partial [Paenibacillus sepulcri]|nr:helix-turn-helix domain-containing protein [Paenibacillus sepulcri]
SETHFRERFRSRYGIWPLEYLTSVRLGAARRLLLVSGRSVREVAHRVGYRDEFYFSRLFRKHTGVTPSQYARNKERHIVALGYPAVGQLLALGIMPGSAALNSRWSGYYRSYYHLDIPVLQTDAFNDDDGDLIKEIGRISPDVIIGGDFQSHSVQEKLGRIAPSLFTPWSRTDWREQLMTTAVFLERTE